MKKLPIILTLLSLSYAAVTSASAIASANDRQWHYSLAENKLAVNIEQPVSVSTVLKTLSREMQFELDLNGYNAVVEANSFSGDIEKVLNNIVQPASLIISKSGGDAPSISYISVVPVGNEQSKMPSLGMNGAQRAFASGEYKGPAHNKEKFERRLSR